MRKMSVQIRERIWGYRIMQGGNALDLRDIAFAAKIPVRKPGPAVSMPVALAKAGSWRSCVSGCHHGREACLHVAQGWQTPAS